MKSIATLAVALLTATVLCQACLWRNPPPRSTEAVGIDLGRYRLSRPPIELGPGVVNASGLTFNRESGTLFLIQNSPTRVLELSRAGEMLRIIELEGFEDTEDIVHLGGSRYAVLEERRRAVVLIDIAATTTSVTRGAARGYQVEPEATGNKGLEGLTYHPRNREFYAAREKKPRRVYRFNLTDPADPVVTDTPWNAQWHANGLRDLSALHVDEATERLLLLSDESKMLVEVDTKGREWSRLRLRKGEGALLGDVPQAEGVTLGADRTLYLCSEPNLLYIFTPTGG